MLLLFDLDGTLLLTDRAGLHAMHEAGRTVHGEGFGLDGFDFAGQLDPLIWREGMRRVGREPDEATHARFRAVYAEALERRLRERPTARSLPGVAPLLERLRTENGHVLGLLTGNYPETGALKLRAAGLDPAWFGLGAWGSDGEHRRDLPRVAMQRYRELHGRAIDPAEVVVIGDTPRDVDCARANGCLAVAVATGPSFDLAALRAHEPDLLLESLLEADRLLEWLGERANGR